MSRSVFSSQVAGSFEICPVSVLAVAKPLRSAVAMGPKLIVPPSPPLPTPSNFPFQFDAGSHTSKLISEASVGFNRPWTSQNAGKLLMACPAGGVNDPAGMDFASVMVVLGSESAVNPSQFAAKAADWLHIAKGNKPTTAIRRYLGHSMVSLLPVYCSLDL